MQSMQSRPAACACHALHGMQYPDCALCTAKSVCVIQTVDILLCSCRCAALGRDVLAAEALGVTAEAAAAQLRGDLGCSADAVTQLKAEVRNQGPCQLRSVARAVLPSWSRLSDGMAWCTAGCGARRTGGCCCGCSCSGRGWTCAGAAGPLARRGGAERRGQRPSHVRSWLCPAWSISWAVQTAIPVDTGGRSKIRAWFEEPMLRIMHHQGRDMLPSMLP